MLWRFFGDPRGPWIKGTHTHEGFFFSFFSTVFWVPIFRSGYGGGGFLSEWFVGGRLDYDGMKYTSLPS